MKQGRKADAVPTSSENARAQLAEDLIDMSGLTSTQKGHIVENRIRELLLLHGRGELSVYEPASDIEAIDLVVLKKGEFKPVFLQVKSRFTLVGKNKKTFVCDVREKTFQPHPMFYVVYAYFDVCEMEIHDNLFLVPSIELAGIAMKTNPGGKGVQYRFSSSMDPREGSKWAPYVVKKTGLAGVLLETIKSAYVLFK